MTERLYYADSYSVAFDATVLRVEHHGGRTVAILDRTAFYPASGGQPFDTGTLGSARVVEVSDHDDGTILHHIDGDVGPGPVHGHIDWERRFEHMQQHTGQHVLSAAFDRLHGVRTESFHLGSASSTIDLARQVTPAEIQQAEREANRIVWENHSIGIRFANAADAATLPLRKESARIGVLRLVDVEGYDVSACGGTHVSRTGGIGIIAVASWEKCKGATRLEFLCGVRALRGYEALRDSVAASIQLLSVLPGELPGGIARLQSDARETGKLVRDLQSRLALFEATVLADRAVSRGASRHVVEALEGWDASGLKTIATAIAGRSGYLAALFSAPPPSAVVIACAPEAGVDCAAMLTRLTDRFGGKGGGRPQLAQGGGLQGDVEDMLVFTRALTIENV